VVLKKDWFAAQKAFVAPPFVQGFKGGALMRFVTVMLGILRSAHITPAAMHHYLQIETPAPENAGDGSK
jgi:hypothetical protein